MSFLSRDAFEDGPADMGRPQPLAGNRPPSAVGGRPTTGASEVSQTASLLNNDSNGYGAEDLRTPTSQVNMREKMLQQRQKMLAAKQRQTAAGSGSMVLANSSTPSVPTPMGSRPVSSPSSGSGPRSMSGQFSGPPANSTFEVADVDRERARLEANGDGAADKSSLVIPQMTPEMKEEEARRRSTLSQELSDRGICPEYDPTDGLVAENRVSFDAGAIQPNEMRAFLHNPMPKGGGMLQCRIVRDKSGIANRLSPKYVIESDAGVFLMAAQKQSHNKTPNYAVSMAKAKVAKGTDEFLGKLRSDVCGLAWMGYGPGLNPDKAEKGRAKEAPAIQLVRDELLGVSYSASFWGTKPKGPRKMTVTIPRVQPNGERLVCRTLNPATEGLLALTEGSSQLVENFTNKSPKWNDTIGAYVLNFNKRVTEASVKNFQLVNQTDPDTVYLQFGKVGKDAFNIDFRYPFSPFQAFAICLTAFEYKLGCE